jgi:hypothetical protein
MRRLEALHLDPLGRRPAYIVALTGALSTGLEEAGADGFFPKPIDPKGMLALVETLRIKPEHHNNQDRPLPAQDSKFPLARSISPKTSAVFWSCAVRVRLLTSNLGAG